MGPLKVIISYVYQNLNKSVKAKAVPYKFHSE